MKTQSTSRLGAPLRESRVIFIASILSALLFVLAVQSSHAGSATWNLNPTSGDWNTAANWTPATVPNSSSDTATFGSSTVTAISTSAHTPLNGIVFSPGASAFTITASALAYPNNKVAISGTGIINNSGITQNFVNAADEGLAGNMFFEGTATAGDLTAFTNKGTSLAGGFGGGKLYFISNATAGNGT